MSTSQDFHFDPPTRILLGPGPSQVPARVLSALARPTVGYLDPTYLALMERVQVQLRHLFQTQNEATFTVTGAGTAAMECALLNLVEPGEKAIVCRHGYFGERMRQILERGGAEVVVVDAPWGQPSDPSALDEALKAHPDAKLVGLVHGETSTGVRQDISTMAEVAHRHDALLLVDTVASLGGAEFRADAWGADAVYTGSQKCLSAPPGISPITFNARAMEKIERRKTPCRSWYLDVALNLTYWKRPAAYHHTGPINLTYALHEACNILEEEGLDARFARTTHTAEAMWAGLEALGLGLFVAKENRLPTLTTVLAPDGVDEAKVRAHLMGEFGIEIVGGLGDLKGRAWRIGLMGDSCSRRNVILLLGALEQALHAQGHQAPAGAGVAAATEIFDQ